MAPRRGGGGSSSSSGSSTPTCPGAFQGVYSTEIAYFVSFVLFFVVILGILIANCKVRKRHNTQGRRIIGPIYILSLVFFVIGYGLLITATVLRECNTTPLDSFYIWAIVYTIFLRLATFLLLVVVMWSVNMRLREQLNPKVGFWKIIYIAILGLMGALTCAYIGLSAYNYWTFTYAGRESDAETLGTEQNQFLLGYYILYLFSVVAAGAFSIISLVSLRSRQHPVGDLLGWIIALTICMFIWVLFLCIEFGASVQQTFYLTRETYQAFEYLIDIFQCVSFIILLFIAKASAWNNSAVANTSYQPAPVPPTYPIHNGQQPQQQPVYYPVQPQQPQQQQYAYAQPNGQQQYYPVYNGQPMAQAK